MSLATLTAGLGHPSFALARRRPGLGARRAGVLALFSDVADPDLVVIERAAGLRKHAGQMALPGGGMDPGDADEVAAALRETHEEIGLAPDEVRVLGQLPGANVAVSRYDVVTAVGAWSGLAPISAVDRGEVAAVHRLLVRDLADPANRVSYLHPRGFTGPAFVIDGVFIWGFTGHLIDYLLDLGGWARPWDEFHTAEVPRRFMRDTGEPLV
ncbi:MAG TPA: CoA pyrophosphatase [Propionibacteriaceae bacterium]|nr:CoA pyrophosphatase [Propionibacteriaceae bacterium]